ncbi:AAA ATPase midasin, partial [Coemansia sp. RSA 1843]
TQEIVRPHPHFMLFAMQNPAGLYGGRKALSRAFRNRFVELHFDDIPEAELQQIITDSCRVPPTHAALLVAAYRNLTQVRAQNRIFEASHGFVTLRDLFRWANRHASTKDELAEHGFMLLAERVRSSDEQLVVRRAIERAFYSKVSSASNASIRRAIDVDDLYSEERLRAMPEFQAFESQSLRRAPPIAWTKAMRRLFVLTALCVRFHEPILLVGETGCGKTTVCQMLAAARDQQLHIVNCHQNTESSDILGGQRPVRNRAAFVSAAHAILCAISGPDHALLPAEGAIDSPDALHALVSHWRSSEDTALQAAVDANAAQLEAAHELLARSQGLFAWHDGPLVQAMKQGDMFLMDELNLADDSVLERLNSVLEPSRTLVLAENVGAASLTAAEGFEFVATMNPGGDYGKRELSPALRNRFTELWAPTTQDRDDLQLVLLKRLEAVPEADACARVILDFVACLRDDMKMLQNSLSLRDYLFWADFVAKTHVLLGARASVVHGACLVLLDGVGAQGSIFGASTMRLPSSVKAECVARLRSMAGWSDSEHGEHDVGVVPARSLISSGEGQSALAARIERKDTEAVGVAPFFVECGPQGGSDGGAFALDAPTTFDNLVKILRAMQVGKPLLLEGSPGVGKTTLVSTLARLAGHQLVRINLSDQTDLMDLFGTDLPVDGGFAWCDAPFLQALKRGDWVLLDEINLASQSVLEGLNSCLDHRGTVYIAELDREFTLAPGFRLFAAQNPLGQGGGRKGLPRSFVNRFTQVYMDELTRNDLLTICNTIYAGFAANTDRVLEFNWRMHDATMTRRLFGAAGAPWEFNLRDVSRFMELALQPSTLERGPKPVDEFVAMLYIQRMRTLHDRVHVAALFCEVFGRDLDLHAPVLHTTDSHVQIGNAVLPRLSGGGGSGGSMDYVARLTSLHGQLAYLESLAKCIEMRWMAILVGPAGCGKTSMVRWLASATGNRLIEFSMNSGVDTSEIIGGFEQVDVQRHRTSLLSRVDALLRYALLACGENELSGSGQAQQDVAIVRAYGLFHAAKRCPGTRDLCKAVEQILDIIGEPAEMSDLVDAARSEASELAALEAAGRFEWVDGVLVDALVNGHWLLVDRANLCSASVLDRLNGLLEPNGVLYVTEDPKRTSAVVPHPNFRIIMAVDPQHGELSRAMRNRGIEICILPPSTETENARRIKAIDQAAVAQSVGLSDRLIPADMASESTLTAVVHHAVRVTERTQRGFAVHLNGADAHELLAVRYAPAAFGSAVSVACWQANLARRALAASSVLERVSLFLAVTSTLPPDAGTQGAVMFSTILLSRSSSSSSISSSRGPVDAAAAVLAAPLTGAMRQARALVAAECQLESDVLFSAPSYVPLNASLHRALSRYGETPAVRWHQALCTALLFQRERIAASSGAVGDAASITDTVSARQAALQRPDTDIAYVQCALDLADGCDSLVNEWDTAIASRDSVADSLSVGCDLAACVPALRVVYRLAHRIRHLIGAENGSSALAVAFEEVQGVLQAMVRSQVGVAGDQAQRMLVAVRPLVLDAAHSTRLWTLMHPTTLCDQNEREIESQLLATRHRMLLASTDDTSAADLREAVVEAIAMLYATTGRSDRCLIVSAVAKFAASLPASDQEKQVDGGKKVGGILAPADVLADVRALSEWRKVARLAVLSSSGSSSGSSELQELSVAQLRTDIVSRMSVGSESSWAPVFARLSWTLNEQKGAKQRLDMLPLLSDIVDQWHEQMGKQSFADALDTPSLRLSRPVATELTWRSAVSLSACTLADHNRVHQEAVGMLRALATYTPPEKAPEHDLAALVWLVAQAISTVCGPTDDCAELQDLSALVAVSLLKSDDASSKRAANAWGMVLERTAAADERVAECIAPAADAIHAALASSGAEMQCHVLAATIAVHTGMLMLSVPRRAVDPAARAHTRWAWLGEDIDAARADFAAFAMVQQSMTGDTDTVATRPFARTVRSLEAQQAAIERVYRPDQALPFAELWQEAHTLCSSVLARVRDVCQRLMNGASGGSSLPLAAAHALVITLTQFQSRVRRRYYEAFRDVAQIWCTHARAIAHALAHLAEERSRADSKTTVHRENAELIANIYAMPVADVPATDASNASMEHTLARLKATIFFAQKMSEDGQPGSGRSALKAYGELLKALLLRTTLGIQARGRVAPADVAALGAVFRDAHDIHRRAAEAKRRRDAEAASLFKLRAPVEQTDDDLVRELFPGYEDLFDEADGEEGDHKPSEAGDSSGPTNDDLDEDTVTAIAACHQYVMLQFNATECAPDLRAPIVHDAQQAALRLAASAYGARHDVAALQPDGTDSVLRAANMAALATIAAASDASPTARDGATEESSSIRSSAVRDFYRDAWPSEAVRLKPVAQAIAERACFLLREWPEHAGLQLIRGTAERLISEPVTSPVARLLAGVEQLHTRALDSWETYAARDVSMSEELAAATRLIIRWRQAELNAWPHVLRAQELVCARRAASEWWFSLYAVLVAAEESSSSVAELSAALDHFAHGCPAGEFRARLNLLLAFATHRASLLSARATCDNGSLADAMRTDAIYGPLVNAIGYYLQFAPCVGDHLARAKKPIQKDLAQYVKISSWKDVNPAALRASAQRTHRHLAKCVRQWREALAQPAFQIIQAHQASGIVSAQVPLVSLVSTPLTDAGTEVAPVLLTLAAATRGCAASPWEIPDGAASSGDDVAAAVAELARSADPELAKVLDASPVTLQRLRRLMENSPVFGKHRVCDEAIEDVFGEFAQQAAGDIRHFQGMETPSKLLKKPASKDGSNTADCSVSGKAAKRKRGKHIIGGAASAAAATAAGSENNGDEEEIDDEERQRLVQKFWGEQRNLRRTRLKEILRGLQDLGLKRHFRTATGTSEEDSSAQTAVSGGGLAGLLQLRPLDIQSWRSATCLASSADPRLVLSTAARTLSSLQTADAAFFRLSAQIAQLRTAAFDNDRNPETTGAQVRAISGLIECLNHHVVHDRVCAADLVADAATLMRVASAWPPPSTVGDAATPDNAASAAAAAASVDELKLATDAAAALLLQLRTNVRAISQTDGWGVHASGVDRAMAPVAEAADQFTRAHAALSSASSMVVSFRAAGIDSRTADVCASAHAHVREARCAVDRAARAVIEALDDGSSGSDLDPRVLDPWVRPASAAAAHVVRLCSAVSGASAVAAQQGSSGDSGMAGLAALAGRWVTGVMGVWQAIHVAESQVSAGAASEERNMWGFTPKELVRRLAVLQATAQALKLPVLLPVIRDLTRQRQSVQMHGHSADAIDRCVQPWVHQYSLMVQHVVSMHAEMHRSVVHFALGMAVSLTSVIAHGMGPQGDSLEEPEESGNASTQTGTGMGEGSTAGAKNVSDEIEGEDQVEGLRDDGDGKNEEEDEPETNEDAVDMQNDFEGKLGDADLETDDSDSDKSDDSDDEDQDMDEQMGDVDPTDPTALDEKLWDDEKDGEDENKDSAKDADESVDSKAKKSKPEADIVAGQEDGDDAQQDNDGESKEPAGQGEDDASGTDDEMRSDGDEEGEGDDEGSGDELDDRINKDTLDRMADVDDLGEQLEMPDDLDMDNGGGGDEEEEDEGDADMGGDDLPEDEPIDQKPDAAMDEDSAEKADDNDGADDAAEGEDGEKADADDDGKMDEAELEGDVSDMGGDQDEADRFGNELGEDEDEDEDEDEEEEDDVEKGRENALIDEESQLNKDEEEAAGADNPTGGLDSAMNLDGNDEANADAAAESQDALAQPSNSSNNQQQQSQPDASGTAQQQQQPDRLPQGQSEQEDSSKRNMDSERTLADVIEKWERRLNIVMREDEPQPQPTDEAEAEHPDNKDDDGAAKQNNNSSSSDQQPAPESSEFEHVKEDEDFDKVALADANDEELEKQQHQPMDIDEEESHANDGQQQQEEEEANVREQEEKMDDEAPAEDSAAASKAQANPQQQAEPKTQPRQPPTDTDKDSRNAADAAQLQQSVAPDDVQDSDGDGHMSEDEAEGGERQQETVDIGQLREELEAKTAEWRANSQDSEHAVQLWQAYTRLTHELSLMLTEQLRLILTPTQATQLKGDYRTGKRLNMKRIIPYIASEFRKDKIWLRRTKPARREYQVMVALDNSKSMAQSSHAVELAYETLALITTALTQLEVGQLSVVSFGEQVSLLHPFDSVFDSDAGARVLSRFTFADDKTDVVQLMDASLQLFEAAEQASSSSSELWRLQLVVSDGVCQDHARLLQQVRAAMEQRVMVVFIVLDRSAIATAGSSEAVDPEKDSIMNTQHVSFVKGINGKMEMRVERYLDTFPFKYYVVLRDIHGLPAVLAETLRQYFSLVGNA